MSKKVAQVIVETLQSAGVKNCYGIVGDTLNSFATCLSRSDIKFVHMRHEEAGAYAAQGEALLMDRLTAVAGSCGPGSLHFINGLYEANRNRAPVILIASQVVRSELGFDFIQEVNFQDVYRGCSVFCEMILTAEWLGQPGPALLNVKVEPMELVMPPFTAPEAVYGMAMYSIKAVMHGKAGDVFEMIGENFI
jgi:thiamine pyrophosphate-dependent acetolactate synthase large subunit-like protein